ncbi:MAG: cobalamin-binding protein [Gammaproteobacteria bacterium]|nr:cobalamin-binding protein [Gammaproteobacteria bacterium]
MLLSLLLAVVLPQAVATAAQRCVADDALRTLCIDTPAQRIATLSPGATELTFAAGAGEQVIAGVSYSDYPPAALKLPLVGNHTRIDVEALLALKPDLIVTWVSGNPTAQVELLQELGLPIFAIEPRTFEGVSSAIERLSILAGTEEAGFAEAERFRSGIAAIAEQYRDAKPVSVFYQVWETPLMTINNTHLIGKVLQLCGGVNVFADMPRLVPRISPEVVLQADPEVILTGSVEGASDQQLDHWKKYPKMRAVALDNLFFVPSSPISRPTPRLLEASRDICQKLDIARGR